MSTEGIPALSACRAEDGDATVAAPTDNNAGGGKAGSTVLLIVNDTVH